MNLQSWPDLAGRINSGVHVLPIRVYYEDTDFSGIVYHANYLRFAERGRSDFLRLMGISHAELFAEKGGLAFAVHRMEIDFTRPSKIDDLLEVQTRFLKASGARLEAEQIISRVRPDGTHERLWRALVFIACLNGRRRATRLPQRLQEKFTEEMTASR